MGAPFSRFLNLFFSNYKLSLSVFFHCLFLPVSDGADGLGEEPAGRCHLTLFDPVHTCFDFLNS